MKFTSIDDVITNGNKSDICDFVYPNFDTKNHNIKNAIGRKLMNLNKNKRKLKIDYDVFLCTHCNEEIEVEECGNNIVIVNDTNCFEMRDYEYTINSLSGKIVIANKLHKYTNIKSYIDDYDLNVYSEIEKMTKEYSKENFFIGYVGNNSVIVYKTSDGFCIRESNEMDYKTHSNDIISCSLWWIMATPIENVNMNELKKSGDKYIILDIESNTDYKFITDFNTAYFKFTK